MAEHGKGSVAEASSVSERLPATEDTLMRPPTRLTFAELIKSYSSDDQSADDSSNARQGGGYRIRTCRRQGRGNIFCNDKKKRSDQRGRAFVAISKARLTLRVTQEKDKAKKEL